MISGGRILWNAVAICEMTETSWQTGNLKMNEDLVNPSRTCFVRGRIFWLEKVRCIRNISQKTECERSPGNPKRWKICISCGRWFSKIITEKIRVPGTHSETGIHSKERENLIGEPHGDREEFRPEEWEDDAEDREYFWSVQGYFICGHHIEPRVQLTCRQKNHSLFPRFKLLNETPPRRNFRCGCEEDWRKALNIWGKKKSSIVLFDIAGKDGILYFVTTLRTNSFRWKDLKKSFHIIFF